MSLSSKFLDHNFIITASAMYSDILMVLDIIIQRMLGLFEIGYIYFPNEFFATFRALFALMFICCSCYRANRTTDITSYSGK